MEVKIHYPGTLWRKTNLEIIIRLCSGDSLTPITILIGADNKRRVFSTKMSQEGRNYLMDFCERATRQGQSARFLTTNYLDMSVKSNAWNFVIFGDKIYILYRICLFNGTWTNGFSNLSDRQDQGKKRAHFICGNELRSLGQTINDMWPCLWEHYNEL